MISAHNYGTNAADEAVTGTPAPDGGHAILGQSEGSNIGSLSMYLVKTDQGDTTGCQEESLGIPIEDTFALQAQPFQDTAFTINSSLSAPTIPSNTQNLLTQNACISCDTPEASFNFTSTDTNRQYRFTNESKNGETFHWTIGDSTIQTKDLLYTFSGDGSYTVCLEASNACGSDMTCDNLEITGIGNAQKAQPSFHMFPNPARDEFHVKSNVSSPAVIKVFDVKGQMVYEATIVKADQAHRIKTAGWKSGTYLVEVAMEGTTYTRKMVVQ